MKEEIGSVKGDDTGTIESLIDYLNEQKRKGATHYKMEWSNDPMWAFKWFTTYRIKSDEEIKKEKIESLKRQLKELENENN